MVALCACSRSALISDDVLLYCGIHAFIFGAFYTILALYADAAASTRTWFLPRSMLKNA